MMELTLYINGMMCANCSQKLEEKASKLAEIEEIHVNYASAKINVKFKQDSDKIKFNRKFRWKLNGDPEISEEWFMNDNKVSGSIIKIVK